MKEKRLLYFALGVVTVVSLVGTSPLALRNDGIEFPDGTVQTTAAPADPRRAFYLTNSSWDGASTLSACAQGFHMASLWEILDVSNLRYATEQPDARTHFDSGAGPPSGTLGRVRTGWGPGAPPTVGTANCHGWTSNGMSDFGSTVSLISDWAATDPHWIAPWHATLTDCSQERPAFCVADGW